MSLRPSSLWTVAPTGQTTAHGLWIAHELVARDGAHHAAPFHQVVVLRTSQGIALTDAGDFKTAAVPQRLGRANRIGIETGAGAKASAARATVAEVNRHAVV